MTGRQRIRQVYIVDDNGNDVLCDANGKIAVNEKDIKDLNDHLEIISDAAQKTAAKVEEQEKEISGLKNQIINLQQTELETHRTIWSKLFGRKERVTETDVNLDERS